MTEMTTSAAKKIVRDLASQDCEDVDRRETADTRPGQQIAGWRQAAREAGDDGVVEAIDLLGIDEAQAVYDAAREALA